MTQTQQALTEETLRPLVERFYDRVGGDPALAPVFASAISGWSEHRGHLAEFWSSVLLGQGKQGGYPVQLHLRHAAALTPDLFRRWLSMWRITRAEMLANPPPAQQPCQSPRALANVQLSIRRQRPLAADHAESRTAS